MTDNANIIELMNGDIDNANLEVCEALDAHGDTLFLSHRTINITVVGWHCLTALQQLFGFESTADLSQLVLWPMQAMDENMQQLLQQKDANGDPLIDIVVVSQESYNAASCPLKDDRIIISTNTTPYLPWLFLNIVEKVPAKKKLLLVDNIYTLGFVNSKHNRFVISSARDAFFECLPHSRCTFTQTKAYIERKLGEPGA